MKKITDNKQDTLKVILQTFPVVLQHFVIIY